MAASSFALHHNLGWGWRWSGTGLNRAPIPDMRERRTITLILEWWLEGKKYREIAQGLAQLHIRARGGRPWTTKSIVKALRAGHKLNRERLNLPDWDEMVKKVAVAPLERVVRIGLPELGTGKPMVIRVERHAWQFPDQESMAAGVKVEETPRVVQTQAGLIEVDGRGWLYQAPRMIRRRGPDGRIIGENDGSEVREEEPTAT